MALPTPPPPHPLTQTMPLEASGGAEPQHLLPISEAGDEVSPRLPREAITTTTTTTTTHSADDPVPGSGPPAHPLPRHVVGDRLGLGASGEVYAVHDRNLQRTVAVKILPRLDAQDGQARSQLISEARMTASLSHPNVLPVYDLDIDLEGRAYFSMKRVEGHSLGYVLEQSAPETRHEAISTGSRIVNLFIGVAQALAYAHQQGVVHQDIKPDNIMLGQYGEILVVDWGSACRLVPGVKPRLYGTPLYMSPEQARSESVDARSDVYCIGASLLQVLLLRPPTWCEDLDLFWSRKRAGMVDEVSPAESRQAPAELLSIAMKALRADPRERYQDGEALLQDLRLYQAGLPVSAHHDSLLESGVRWYRSYRREFWMTLAVASLVGSLLLLIYDEWVKEIASWGHPVVREDFRDDRWSTRWVVVDAGRFERREGGLEAVGNLENQLVCTQKFSGGTAIEYDCETLPGNPLGDMSAVWYTDVVLSPDRSQILQLKDPHCLQFGAFNGAFSQITSQESGEVPLSWNAQHPLSGQRYHVRAQVADGRLDLIVNGRTICSWTEPFSFNSGYFALKAFYPGKVFRNVRIYSRGVAQKVVATAIGDAFVEHGDLGEAESEYARVYATYPDSALGREALFKQGLCAYRADRHAEAFRLWNPLRGGVYDLPIRQQDIDHLYQQDRHAEALEEIRTLYPRLSLEDRHRLAHQWSHLAVGLAHRQLDQEAEAWLQVHDAVFIHEDAEDGIAANILYILNRYQEVLDRYPQQRVYTAFAHLNLGHFQILLDQYPDQFYQHDLAAYCMGRVDRIDRRFQPELYHRGLWYTGHSEEALQDHPDDPELQARALALQGRTDAAIAVPGLKNLLRDMILCNAGRTGEVSPANVALARLAAGESSEVTRNGPIDWAQDMATNLQAMQLWRDHQHALALSTFRSRLFHPYYGALMLFVQVSDYSFNAFAVPLLRSLDATPELFDAACRQAKLQYRDYYQQQLWYQARYLLGEIDDRTFLQQPWKIYAPAQLTLMQGLRADHGGQRDQAIRAYATWQSLPAYARDEFPNPVWTEFVRWRLERLRATTSAPQPPAEQAVPASPVQPQAPR